MKLCITGICGFVGSQLAGLLSEMPQVQRICGIDNFSRPGSKANQHTLTALGIDVFEGDVRNPDDLAKLPKVDWVIEAAANPSVLAGRDGQSSSRELMDINLNGTINTLEFARDCQAGLILLSTSRVYSIPPLAQMPVRTQSLMYVPDHCGSLPEGVSPQGIDENFSTQPPLSLYGVSKRASELVALEYANAFDMPVWVNRCGVMAGAGQFGRPDQGVFAYWVYSWFHRRSLKYIGFNGKGYQVRDVLHPRDLVTVLMRQMTCDAVSMQDKPRLVNLSGGLENAMSLAQISAWCTQHLGEHDVAIEPANRTYDLPWVVLDSRLAQRIWDWKPQIDAGAVLEELAEFIKQNPHWLDISAG